MTPQPPNSQIEYPVVIITGLSGSGKSTALRALEDIGFFCVDNLPLGLLSKFLQLQSQVQKDDFKVALVMDVRTEHFLSHHDSVFRKLREKRFHLYLVFLEATDEVLIRRFSETRRQHPLADQEPILKALRNEREQLKSLRDTATRVIDTSYLTSHQLRELMTQEFSQMLTSPRLHLHLISFGFKYGLPPEADIVMDVRFLPNPYFVKELSEMTGNQAPVQDFVLNQAETNTFLNHFFPLLDYLLPLYHKEGKTHLTVALGCSGGKHRSVVIANALKRHLSQHKFLITINHRDITRG
ncbi:MAG: RNase adapter RapZ [Deltaproteobacteria bacterium]|nr:MAG: RNase adapter RapZ [Deltaproteobacteria bacterium]